MKTFNRNEGGLPAVEFSEAEQEKRRNFEISIFGTSRNKTEDEKKAIEIARELAIRLVNNGHRIKTGGSASGVMEEASRAGFEEAEKIGREDLIPEGISIAGGVLGAETQYAEITQEDNLLKRLNNLEDAEALVVLNGTTGTVAELVTSIVDSIIKRMESEKNERPIIIADSSLKHADILDFLRRMDPAKMNAMMEHAYFVSSSDGQEAGEIADEIDFIIESYYKKSVGEELSDEDRSEMAKFDLKKFLDAKNEFEGGAGI